MSVQPAQACLDAHTLDGICAVRCQHICFVLLTVHCSDSQWQAQCGTALRHTRLFAIKSTDPIFFVLGLLRSLLAISPSTFPYCRCTDYSAESQPYFLESAVDAEAPAGNGTFCFTVRYKGANATAPTCYGLLERSVHKLILSVGEFEDGIK